MPVAIGAILGGLVGTLAAPVLGITAALGWSIGSLLGQFLFAKPNNTSTVVEGSRLENLSPAVSNVVGSPIQIPYGTTRIPGSIIWSNNITEVEKREVKKQKAKSGSKKSTSKTTTVTYEYYLDFAVAICEGEISGIRRIWANNKLIYDGVEGVQENWLNFRVYRGTEDQLPDPIMESIDGVGNVPGYRGLAYVMFRQFFLEPYGNRAPYNIDFEVVAGLGNENKSNLVYTTDNAAVGYYSAGYVSKGYVEVIKDNTKVLYMGTGDTSNNVFKTINIYNYLDEPGEVPRAQAVTNYIERQLSYTELHESVRIENYKKTESIVGVYDNNGSPNIVVSGRRDITTSYEIVSKPNIISLYTIDGDYIQYKKSAYSLLVNGQLILNKLIYYLTSFNTIAVINPIRSNIHTFNLATDFSGYDPDYWYLFGVGNGLALGSNIIEFDKNMPYRSYTGTFLCGDNTETVDDIKIYTYNINDIFYTDENDNNTWELTEWLTLNIDNIPYNVDGSVGNAHKVFPDGLSSSIHSFAIHSTYDFLKLKNGDVWLCMGISISGGTYNGNGNVVYFKVDMENSVLEKAYFALETRTYNILAFRSSDNYLPTHSPMIGHMDWDSNVYTVWCNHQFDLYRFNFNLEKWYTPESFSKPTGVVDGFGEFTCYPISDNKTLILGTVEYPLNNSFNTGVMLLRENEPDEGGVTLSSIVSDISQRAGMDVSDFDVTDLADIIVPGYDIRDRESARQSIDDVTLPYIIDKTQSDWIIKYKKRSSIDTITEIDYDDLGTADSSDQRYNILIPDEATLPKELDFRYIGTDNSYQVAHQRAAKNSRSTNTIDKRTVNSTVVLEDTTARNTAQQLLTNMWANSRTVSFSVPKKYSYLEPNDLIKFPTKGGTYITARIVEISNNYGRLNIQAEFEETKAVGKVIPDSFAASYDTTGIVSIKVISAMLTVPVDMYPMDDIFTYSGSPIDSNFIVCGARGSSTQGWPGGQLYFSYDGSTYYEGDVLNQESVLCSIVSVSRPLGDIENINNIDYETSIVVSTRSSSFPSTVTDAEFFTGLYNNFYIPNDQGGEIISAKTITYNASDNTYTLTNLWRGRYHSTPSTNYYSYVRMLYLDPTNVKVVPMEYGIYDVDMFYKGVTLTASPNSANSYEIHYNSIFQDTVPCIDIQSVVDGSDIDITWTGVSNYATTPFNCEFKHREFYKLNIYDASDDSLIRTEEDLTDAEYTYLAADLSTDGYTTSDIFKYGIIRKSEMKEYDTNEAFAYSSTSFYEVLDYYLSPDAYWDFSQLVGGDVIDLVGSYGIDLSVTAGSFVENSTAYNLKENRKTGVLQASNDLIYGNSTHTMPTGFSFTFVGIIDLNIPDSDSSWNQYYYLYKRASGPFSASIKRDGNTIYFRGYAENRIIYNDIDDGIEPFMWAITVEASGGGIKETLYINGEYLDDYIQTSSVNAWNGDFTAGDIDNISSGGSHITMDFMAYYDSVLTATQIEKIYTIYQEFKV